MTGAAAAVGAQASMGAEGQREAAWELCGGRLDG